MTPWRAMIVAPLLAAAVVIATINGPAAIGWLQSLPLVGSFFQRMISPNAASAAVFLGVLCPAIPAIIAVALYRASVQMVRDWKAQRIRERRKTAWLNRDRAVEPVVEQLVQRKDRIDNRGKTI
jgi:hypothetical protein